MTALVVAVGCTGTTPGDAGPVVTTSETTSSENAAPSINGPDLSLDKFSGDPCTLLSAEQVAKLGGVKPGERLSDRPAGVTCRWAAASGSTEDVSYSLVVSKKTLSDYYQNKDQFPAFEPTEVAGYPAVNFGRLDLKAGDCDTIVGLSKSAALLVQTSSETGALNYGTPCKNTEKAAALALETVKGNQ